MSPSNKPRPEAVTTAKWWADVLRKFVVELQPTAQLSPEDVPPGRGSQNRRDYIKQAKEAVKVLTPERIARFQQRLAESVELSMWASRDSSCAISQPEPKDYRNDEVIQSALQEAGIDPFLFGGKSIFPRSLTTIVQPGRVMVIDYGGDRDGLSYLEIVNE